MPKKRNPHTTIRADGVPNPGRRSSAGSKAKRTPPIAKITHPKTAGLLHRERLFRLLDEYGDIPVTWISAPAGSGKTSLVASYLADRKLKSIWYRVDERDGDIAAFFYYMGLAAKKAAPRKRSPLPLLTPECLLGIQTFILRYFESLYSRLKPPFRIVLDNYQLAQFQSDFHNVISKGADLIPDGITMIVTSRRDPPPQFARLRMEGKIRPVPRQDILFNLDESKELIRSKGYPNSSESAVRRIHERTRGWAAGLVLLTDQLANENLDDPICPAGTPQQIFDYFATETFDKTDLEKRQFLLKTAFLPWVTVEIAQRLTGNTRSAQILTDLHKNQFFTERNAGPSPIYRYHPLFRDFLLSRATRALSREEILQIQKTAAALLVEAGHPDEAAAFFLDAGDWDRFVPFVLNHAEVLTQQGRIKTLGKWLDAIPMEIAVDSPWLLYWKGQSALATAPVQGRAYLEQAFRLFNERRDDTGTLLTWIGLGLAYVFGFEDLKPVEQGIDWLDERMGRDPSFPSLEIEADVASIMALGLMWRRPDRIAMAQWMDRALLSSRATRNSTIRRKILGRALLYNTWIGDKNTCLTLLDELMRMSGSTPAHPMHRIAEKMIRANYYAWVGDDSEQAMKLVEEGLALAEKTGIHLVDPYLAIQGARSASNKGDEDKILQYIKRLSDYLPQGSAYIGYYYQFVSIRHLLNGKIAEALAFATKMLTTFKESGMPLGKMWARMLIAQLAYEMGDAALAEKELNDCIRFFHQAGFAHFEYAACLLKAYHLFIQEQVDLGLEVLGQAMRLGRQRGYTNATVYPKEILSLLCAKALEKGIESEYVREFIRKGRLAPPSQAAEHDGWPWPVKIFTLGRFMVLIEGRQLEFGAKAPRRVISLLKLLVSCGQAGAGEEKIADILWPDSEGDAAHRSFAISLHRLRQLLGGAKVLILRDGVLKIDPQICWVDAHAFEGLLALAEKAAPKDKNRLLEKALSLYRGAFLKDSDDPWAISYRERLRYRYMRGVQQLGEILESTGQFDRAGDLYRKGLETDILAEEMYCRLMKCHMAAGRMSAAMATYETCTKVLRSIIGIDPSEETKAVYRALNEQFNTGK
jgi:LuxR family transcriptional regulator, maltose regulon positive regulatory protein